MGELSLKMCGEKLSLNFGVGGVKFEQMWRLNLDVEGVEFELGK